MTTTDHPEGSEGNDSLGDAGFGDAEELELGIEPSGGDEVVVLPWSLMLQRRVAGRVERSPRKAWIILAASLLGVFTASFTITVLTVSLGEIAHDLGSTQSILTWAVTGPSLAMAVLGPIAGYLVIKFGERTIGMFGSIVLVASMMSLAMVTADSGLWLIEGALVLSGIGMGACAPAMIASIANSVDKRDLGVASAASQTVSQIGVVAGMQILLTVQSVSAASGSGTSSYAAAYYVGAGAAVIALAAAFFVRRTQHDEPQAIESLAVA